MSVWVLANHLNLQVPLGEANLDPVIQRESLKQVNSLMIQAVPGIAALVVKGSVSKCDPFLEKGSRGILRELFQNSDQKPWLLAFFFLTILRDSDRRSCSGSADTDLGATEG
jgi:hypothetical protein